MSEAIKTLLQFTGAYLGVAILIFLVLNFLTNGFLWTYLKVKASRGAKCLTIIYSATDIYYRAGSWKENFYNFKDRSKDVKSVPIADVEFKTFIKYTLGVPCIECDEVGNKLVDKDFNVVNLVNVDPARLNSLIMRIKNRPVERSSKEIIIWAIRIISFLALILIVVKLATIEQLLTTLKSVSGNL